MTTELNGLEELEKFVTENEQVVIDFHAAWCQPCKIMSPYFNSLVSLFPAVKFGRVDVDGNVDIARKYNITSMPTFMYFQDGQMQKTVVGASKNNLHEMLKSVTE